MTTRPALMVFLGALAVGGCTGASIEDESEEANVARAADEGIDEISQAALDPLALERAAQARATLYLRYIVGAAIPNPAQGKDAVGERAINELRAYHADGTIRPVSSHKTVYLGLTALVVVFGCHNSSGVKVRCVDVGKMDTHPLMNITYFRSISDILRDVEKFMTRKEPALVSRFFAIKGTISTAEHFEIDPSVARLTANLMGSNGASASATDVTTGAYVAARKWPGTMTYCASNCPPVGNPCSTGDLYSGQETSRVLVKRGSYIQCF